MLDIVSCTIYTKCRDTVDESLKHVFFFYGGVSDGY